MFHNFYSCKKSAAPAAKKEPIGSTVKKERMKILGRAKSMDEVNAKIKGKPELTFKEFTYKKGKNAGKTGYIIVRK